MRVFCSMKRYAFNRLLEDEDPKQLIKRLPSMFKMNKRYAEDAVLQAQSIILSQRELLPMRIEDVEAKLQKLEKKIHRYQTKQLKPKKVDLDTCLSGLLKRKEKLQEKLDQLMCHQEKNTIPAVIFGGKKNFIQRRKGQITQEEWKDLRTNELYARGDKAKKGNLNTRLTYEESEDCFFLEIANPLLCADGKKNAPRIKVKVIVPDKYLQEITQVAIADHPKGPYSPYSIEIKRQNKEYFIYLTYEEEEYGHETFSLSQTHDIIAGIDLNIDRIAVSLVTKQGNWLKSKIFYCHELEYTRTNKRENIIGETVKQMFDWLLEENVGAIVLEKITLRQQHESDKRFNRQTHTFTKTKLTQSILRRAMRMGFDYKFINPAYTSVIGRFKYSKLYGISVHEAASFVIGRRGLGFVEKIPKAVLRILRTKVMSYLVEKLGSMEETSKRSEQGKKERKYWGMLLNNIKKFKEQHGWKLWNVIHKTLRLDQQEYKLKEV